MDQLIRKQQVTGSSPVIGSTFYGLCSRPRRAWGQKRGLSYRATVCGALKSLAGIRRLRLPEVQINMAERLLVLRICKWNDRPSTRPTIQLTYANWFGAGMPAERRSPSRAFQADRETYLDCKAATSANARSLASSKLIRRPSEKYCS